MYAWFEKTFKIVASISINSKVSSPFLRVLSSFLEVALWVFAYGYF